MQSKRWSRRYGWVLLTAGIFISAVMGLVLLAIGPAMLGAVGRGGLRFSGSPGEAKLAFGIIGAVTLFGLTSTGYGVFQIVTGRRSKWVIYFTIGLAVALGLIALIL
jgi:hypothetical protein